MTLETNTKELFIDGVRVEADEEIPEEELKHYVAWAREQQEKDGEELGSIGVTLVDEQEVEIWRSKERYPKPVPFERIRRITGYLVGTLDRFNDAKRAEERDRVKHSVKR